MKSYNEYKSIVNADIFNEFDEQRGSNLFVHFTYSNFIDDFISAAYMMCPDMVEVNGCVFISYFFNAEEDQAEEDMKILEKQFNNNKKEIEQWVNSWGFGCFFLGKPSEALENEKILTQFGDILVYYWSRRAKELFPDKDIVVEYGEELMGETGPTIILYQNTHE